MITEVLIPLLSPQKPSVLNKRAVVKAERKDLEFSLSSPALLHITRSCRVRFRNGMHENCVLVTEKLCSGLFFLHTLSDYIIGLVVLHFDFHFLNKNYVN